MVKRCRRSHLNNIDNYNKGVKIRNNIVRQKKLTEKKPHRKTRALKV